LTQYAGRLHREHHAKKEVLMYDYADLEIPMLAEIYERRRHGYRAIGYEIDE
jgi:superfamily II DNA or RNA helicase